jgi:hypothetical protein
MKIDHSIHFKCIYCGTEKYKATKDHLVPNSKGGKDNQANIRPCCQSCNKWKGCSTLDEWAKKILKAINSGKPKERLGKYTTPYTLEELNTAYGNALKWHMYVTHEYYNMVKFSQIEKERDKCQGFIRLSSSGDIFCYKCKMRGKLSDHQHATEKI